MGALKATLEATTGAFVFFPVDQRRGPTGGGGFRPMRQEDVAREAEHHDKRHQGATRPAYRYVTKMGPVTLGLLSGQRAQAQIGLRFRTWPMAGDDGAEATLAAAIAALPRHRVQAAGGQRRELGQHLADERQIGVDL